MHHLIKIQSTPLLLSDKVLGLLNGNALELSRGKDPCTAREKVFVLIIIFPNYFHFRHTPDDKRIIVLSNGSSKGLIASTPAGGQWAPNSVVGDSALWKKVQKIAKKNKASLTINNATPMFKPLCTASVWLPWYVASEITSLNQSDIENINVNSARYKLFCDKVNPCIVDTRLVVRAKSVKHVKRGQGDGDTKWKGCAWKFVLVIWVIVFCLNFYYIVFQLYFYPQLFNNRSYRMPWGHYMNHTLHEKEYSLAYI